MTMCKEMGLLKSKVEFCKRLMNELDNLNFIYNTNKYDKMIGQYQNELSKIYERIQELKEEEE